LAVVKAELELVKVLLVDLVVDLVEIIHLAVVQVLQIKVMPVVLVGLFNQAILELAEVEVVQLV
jgi:hypothetical protein